MTAPGGTGESEREPVTFVDSRKFDRADGEAADAAASVPAEPDAEPEQAAPAPAEPESDKVEELTADLQRLHAEYANYRRRVDRERQAAIDNAKASVIGALLPVLDDLDRARAHGDLEAGPLKAVADKLAGAFEGLGLAAFGVEGDPFDPAVHEAVQHEGEGHNAVLGLVMRRGYKVGDKVLRTAMVGVVDAVDETGEQRPSEDQPSAAEPADAGARDQQ
ncbi:MAG TPA: nucleotide exchange factor GrpE [Aldersonia sp.]